MRAVKGSLGHSLKIVGQRIGRPSLGLMARPGVPVGGRVRKLRAVEYPGSRPFEKGVTSDHDRRWLPIPELLLDVGKEL